MTRRNLKTQWQRKKNKKTPTMHSHISLLGTNTTPCNQETIPVGHFSSTHSNNAFLISNLHLMLGYSIYVTWFKFPEKNLTALGLSRHRNFSPQDL